MPEFKLTTPVAFIIFNRPDKTARVFAEIAKAKPPKLLVVSDGPRQNRAQEVERVATTRAIIDQVNWPCEVLTNYSDINLGCRKRVSSGIDWVFEMVEEAIILEDDCLPAPSFFRFCQEMLERYRHDTRIGIISGSNFQFDRKYNQDSYYFTKYTHIWGWASWRDRWQNSYDVDMADWPRIRDEGQLPDLVRDVNETEYWRVIFDRVFNGHIDTWDYQWTYTNLREGRLNIMPSVNLISNIGFGADATHTTSISNLENLPVQKMHFPLTHPIAILRNTRADHYESKHSILLPLWKRIYNRFVNRMTYIRK